ncbi:MAG: cytochrome c oxidase assembly protein [Sphingomonadales bacterium]|nr:cytochrome c oxidase assembly protein [Sphingomonadales bacterium]
MRALAALVALAAGGAMAVVVPAQAHGLAAQAGAVPGWTWDPAITVPLAIVPAVYIAGWRRIAARARGGAALLRRRGSWFAFGWLVLVLALVSPLHDGGERSFTLHMIEHELLMLVAAPALVIAGPLPALLWAWPGAVRRAAGRSPGTRALVAVAHRLRSPVPATLVQAAVLWTWHAPALFDLALADPGWHAAQHLAFIASALWFWATVLPRHGPSAGAGKDALAGLCLFATSVVSGMLGALMALSDSPWYAGYARIGMAPLGLDPVQDQQVAGLIMWVPGGVVHAAAALFVVGRLLSAHRGEAAHAR